MAVPQFSTTPNSITSPDTFDSDSDAYHAELAAFIVALNALGHTGGVLAMRYTFSTTTADADPGAGLLRLDNATQNLATTIRADLVDYFGSTWTAVLDTFDDSTSTVKGQIKLVDLDDATKFLIFNVTAVATPSGYRNITVACVASSAASPFANAASLLLTFTRTGDKGETGEAGAAGALAGNATGDISMVDQVFSRALVKDCGLVYVDKGNSGTATQTLDYTAASHQKITVTGAHTIATSNWPPAGNLGELLLELVNGASAAVTWPTINWVKADGSTTTTFSANGVTLQTSGTDWVLLWSRDAGGTIYGKVMR